MTEIMRYQKPSDILLASSAYQQADEPRYLAGGMTLLPTIRQRLAAPDRLIDLADCNLASITSDEHNLTLGAMSTHHSVATSHIVQDCLPALAMLASGIGDRQVRVRGTCGGSLANNDPAACYPAALLALDGTIITDKREIAASDYFVDLFETALDEGEIITAIRLPLPLMAAYSKAPNPASRYALVGSFVARTKDEVRVAITGAGEQGVFRWTAAEAALSHDFSKASLDDISISPEGLMGDIHASPDFRAHMIKTMTQRAVSLAK